MIKYRVIQGHLNHIMDCDSMSSQCLLTKVLSKSFLWAFLVVTALFVTNLEIMPLALLLSTSLAVDQKSSLEKGL